MMDHFDTVFVLVMILFPAIFTLFIRRKETGRVPHVEDTSTSLNAKQHRLWIWTSVAALGFLVLRFSGVQIAAYMMWIAFFPLWFFLALPVLQAKDPGWRGVPRTPVRTATLMRRDVLPASLKSAWTLLTVTWVLMLPAAAAGLVLDAPGAEMWWVLVFSAAGGAELALFYWCGKRSLMEPEPSSASETAEIQSARDDLRNLKLYAWFGAAAVCVVVFSVPPLILIWFGQSALMAAIVIGAVGGTLGGIGGGVFGTMGDLRRAKLNRLCLEESTEPPTT